MSNWVFDLSTEFIRVLRIHDWVNEEADGTVTASIVAEGTSPE